MNDEELLRLAGEALFGRQWQTPLARELGVTDRTIRNWAGGVNRPPDFMTRIVPILQVHAKNLAQVIALAERHQNR